MKFSKYGALAIAGLLSTPAFADLATVDLGLGGPGGGYGIQVSSDKGKNYESQWAGWTNATVSNSSNPNVLFDQAYKIFCIELISAIAWNTDYKFDVVTLDKVPNGEPGVLSFKEAEAVQDMWNFADGKQFTSNDFAAAMQLALWEITFDGNQIDKLSLTDGKFRAKASDTVVDIANSLFASIDLSGLKEFQLLGLQNKKYQDFIVDPGKNTQVSEPGTLGLLGLGLLGFAGLGRRKSV